MESDFEAYCDARIKIRTPARVLTKDDRGWEHYSMTCTLEYLDRCMETPFKQGTAHADAPTAAEVLSCLLSDSQAIDQTFEEWCDNFGYDPDSRAAEATFLACRSTSHKLHNFLGDDYEQFEQAAEGY